jgi:hypothetical protein
MNTYTMYCFHNDFDSDSGDDEAWRKKKKKDFGNGIYPDENTY